MTVFGGFRLKPFHGTGRRAAHPPLRVLLVGRGPDDAGPSLRNVSSAYGPQLASLLALFTWTRPSSSANRSGLFSAAPKAPICDMNKPSTEATTLVAADDLGRG